MQSKLSSRLIIFGLLCSAAWGQPARRIAIMEANGSLARSLPIFALAENQITDALTAKLTGEPGWTLVDRASVDRIIKEQNFQNSDRSSADTAVRIGKLLGVAQVGLVNVYDLGYTTHPETSGRTTRTIGTTVVRANVRLIEVETAAILAQPSSVFQESVTISETTQALQFGQLNFPAKTKLIGDPAIIQKDEWAKASDRITTELATKLTTAMGSAPAPKMASALVAGIASGSVFINEGKAAGVSVGSKFQVLREVSVGLNDPTTGKPILQKQRICVLTIVSTEDTNASGTCQGGLPQSKDVAEPLQP